MEERPWCAAPSLPTGGVELHSPGNMSLRPSAAAPKRAWDSGESSSLPPARRRSAASHPSPKRENYVDKCLWKFPHNMSVNQFYQRPCRCAPHPPPKGHAIMRFTILLRKNVCNTFLHENGSFTSAAAMDLYGCGCKG